jgi:hypothetical protein
MYTPTVFVWAPLYVGPHLGTAAGMAPGAK